MSRTENFHIFKRTDEEEVEVREGVHGKYRNLEELFLLGRGIVLGYIIAKLRKTKNEEKNLKTVRKK